MKIKTNFTTILIAAFLLSCCGKQHIPLRDFLYYYPQDHYTVSPSVATSKGIQIDPGGPINLSRIDRIVDETEECLWKAFAGYLPDQVKKDSSCVGNTFPLPLERDRFVIKIARDWRLNDKGDQQLLPIYAGTGCAAKGQTPPCFWRAIIQDPLELIVPPSMYLLKDVLIRISTGCLNPWASPEMAACAMPSTGPLDNGMGP